MGIDERTGQPIGSPGAMGQGGFMGNPWQQQPGPGGGYTLGGGQGPIPSPGAPGMGYAGGNPGFREGGWLVPTPMPNPAQRPGMAQPWQQAGSGWNYGSGPNFGSGGQPQPSSGQLGGQLSQLLGGMMGQQGNQQPQLQPLFGGGPFFGGGPLFGGGQRAQMPLNPGQQMPSMPGPSMPGRMGPSPITSAPGAMQGSGFNLGGGQWPGAARPPMMNPGMSLAQLARPRFTSGIGQYAAL
jgi:hypothetical protein